MWNKNQTSIPVLVWFPSKSKRRVEKNAQGEGRGPLRSFSDAGGEAGSGVSAGSARRRFGPGLDLYVESGPGEFRGMTSTGVPFGAAGACGARTIRQSARARRDNMLESWISKGVAIRAPDSFLARVARR